MYSTLGISQDNSPTKKPPLSTSPTPISSSFSDDNVLHSVSSFLFIIIIVLLTLQILSLLNQTQQSFGILQQTTRGKLHNAQTLTSELSESNSKLSSVESDLENIKAEANTKNSKHILEVKQIQVHICFISSYFVPYFLSSFLLLYLLLTKYEERAHKPNSCTAKRIIRGKVECPSLAQFIILSRTCHFFFNNRIWTQISWYISVILLPFFILVLVCLVSLFVIYMLFTETATKISQLENKVYEFDSLAKALDLPSKSDVAAKVSLFPFLSFISCSFFLTLFLLFVSFLFFFYSFRFTFLFLVLYVVLFIYLFLLVSFIDGWIGDVPSKGTPRGPKVFTRIGGR